MTVGYARVSTSDQNIFMQVELLKEGSVDETENIAR